VGSWPGEREWRIVTADGPGPGSDYVVVPTSPGPLVRPSSTERRPHDELDAAIDELLPDVAEGPGWFDAVLAVVGAGMVAWALGVGNGALLACGVIVLGLGLVLPARAAWRRAADLRSRRAHASLQAGGTVIDTSTGPTQRLVAAHDAVRAGLGQVAVEPDLAGTVLAAAHDALLEVAVLLQGRPPATAREVAYVEERTTALLAVGEDLRSMARAAAGPGSGDDGDAHRGDLRVAAVEEVDALGGPTSLARLQDADAEVRDRRGRA
jgi:hypothetical protein